MATLYGENTQYNTPTADVPITRKYTSLRPATPRVSMGQFTAPPKGLTEQERVFMTAPQLNIPTGVASAAERFAAEKAAGVEIKPRTVQDYLKEVAPGATPEEYFRTTSTSPLAPYYTLPSESAQVVRDELTGGEYFVDPSQPDKIIRTERDYTAKENELLRNGLNPALYEIDHIAPLWAGGTNSLLNREILLKDDHLTKTKIQAVPLTLLGADLITPEEALKLSLNWRNKDATNLPDPDIFGLKGRLPLELAQKEYARWQKLAKGEQDVASSWKRFMNTLRAAPKESYRDVSDFYHDVILKGGEEPDQAIVLKEFAKHFVAAVPFADILVPDLATISQVPEHEKLLKTGINVAAFTGGLVGELLMFSAARALVMRAFRLLKVRKFAKIGELSTETEKVIARAKLALASRMPAKVGIGKYVIPEFTSKSLKLSTFAHAIGTGAIFAGLGQTHLQPEEGLEGRIKNISMDVLYGALLGTQGHSFRGYANIGALTAAISLIDQQPSADALLNAVTMMFMHGLGHTNGRNIRKLAMEDPKYSASVKSKPVPDKKTIFGTIKGQAGRTFYSPDVDVNMMNAAQRTIGRRLQAQTIRNAKTFRMSYLKKDYSPTTDRAKLQEQNILIHREIEKRAAEHGWTPEQIRTAKFQAYVSGRELYKSKLPTEIRTKEDMADLMSLGANVVKNGGHDPVYEGPAKLQKIVENLPEELYRPPKSEEFHTNTTDPTVPAGRASLGGSGLVRGVSKERDALDILISLADSGRAPVARVTDSATGKVKYQARVFVTYEPERRPEMEAKSRGMDPKQIKAGKQKPMEHPENYVGVFVYGKDPQGDPFVERVSPIARKSRMEALVKDWAEKGFMHELNPGINKDTVSNAFKDRKIKYSFANIEYIPETGVISVETGRPTSFASIYINEDVFKKNAQIISDILNIPEKLPSTTPADIQAARNNITNILATIARDKAPLKRGAAEYAAGRIERRLEGQEKFARTGKQAELLKQKLTREEIAGGKIEKVAAKLAESVFAKPEKITPAAKEKVKITAKKAGVDLKEKGVDHLVTAVTEKVVPAKKVTVGKKPSAEDFVKAKKSIIDSPLQKGEDLLQRAKNQQAIRLLEKEVTGLEAKKVSKDTAKEAPITAKVTKGEVEKLPKEITPERGTTVEERKEVDVEDYISPRAFSRTDANKNNEGLSKIIGKAREGATPERQKRLDKLEENYASMNKLTERAKELYTQYGPGGEKEAINQFKKEISRAFLEVGAEDPMANPRRSRVFNHVYIAGAYSKPVKVLTLKGGEFVEEVRPPKFRSYAVDQIDKVIADNPKLKKTGMDMIRFEHSRSKGASSKGFPAGSKINPELIQEEFRKKGYVLMGAGGREERTIWGIKFNPEFIGGGSIENKLDRDAFMEKFYKEVIGFGKNVPANTVGKRSALFNSHEAVSPIKGKTMRVIVFKSPTLGEMRIVEKDDPRYMRGTTQLAKEGTYNKTAYDGKFFVTEEFANDVFALGGYDGTRSRIKPTVAHKILGDLITMKGDAYVMTKDGFHRGIFEKMKGSKIEKYDVIAFEDNIKTGLKHAIPSADGTYSTIDVPSESWRFKYSHPHKQTSRISLGSIYAKFNFGDDINAVLLKRYKPEIKKFETFIGELSKAKSSEELKQIFKNYEEYGKLEFVEKLYGNAKVMIKNAADAKDLGKNLDTVINRIFQDYVIGGRFIKGDHLILTPDFGAKLDKATGKRSFLEAEEAMIGEKSFLKIYSKEDLADLRAGKDFYLWLVRYPPVRITAFRKAKIFIAEDHGIKNLRGEQMITSHYNAFINTEADFDGDGFSVFKVGGKDGLPKKMANRVEKIREDYGDIVLEPLSKFPEKPLGEGSAEDNIMEYVKNAVMGGRAIETSSAFMRTMNSAVDSKMRIILHPAVNKERKVDIYFGDKFFKTSKVTGTKSEKVELKPHFTMNDIRTGSQVSQAAFDSPGSPSLSNTLARTKSSSIDEYLSQKMFDVKNNEEARAVKTALFNFRTPYNISDPKRSLRSNLDLFRNINEYNKMLDVIEAGGGKLGPVDVLMRELRGQKGFDYGYRDPKYQWRLDQARVKAVKEKFSKEYVPTKNVKDFEKFANEKRIEYVKSMSYEERRNISNSISEYYDEIVSSLTPQERRSIHYWLITSHEANIQNKPSYLNKNIRDQSGYVQRQQAIFNESPDMARTYYEARKNYIPEARGEEPPRPPTGIVARQVPPKGPTSGSTSANVPYQPAGGPRKVTIGGLKTLKGAVAKTPEQVSRTLGKISEKTYKKETVTVPLKTVPKAEPPAESTAGKISFYEGDIKPEPNTIFVFGSNPEGRHGAGAAKVAVNQFGAKYGQGEGLQGNAYALPTKDLRIKENNGLKSIPPKQITESIKKLYEVAKQNPTKQFKVGFRNTNERTLNGYTGLEMIDMFNNAGTIPNNIIFSKEWAGTNKLRTTPTAPKAEPPAESVAPEVKPAGWARYSKNGYEVSSAGDKRFSAFNAKLKDGRTIEEAYQVGVKGHPSIKAGKGKPPVNKMSKEESYQAYKGLWRQWAEENPELMKDLANKSEGKVLTDKFANTEINQARALAEVLVESTPKIKIPEKTKINFEKYDPVLGKSIESRMKELYPEIKLKYTDKEIKFDLKESRPGEDPSIFYQLSQKNRELFKKELTKKRPDLAERGKIEDVLDEIGNFADKHATKIGENPSKLEKIALHWTTNGNIKFPEDAEKVIMALKRAKMQKVDPFQYKSPNEITEKFGEVIIVKRLNPDTVKVFQKIQDNRLENGDVLSVYKVSDSPEGQKVVREMINTHWGKESNPWCLAQGDGGVLTRSARKNWREYTNHQIIFKNGKLHSFGAEPTPRSLGEAVDYPEGNLFRWYDRMDTPTKGITISRKKVNDSLGRSEKIEYFPDTQKYAERPSIIFKGNRQNGEYAEWRLIKDGNSFKEVKKFKYTYKNGLRDGLSRGWHENGQLKTEATFKNGEMDGLFRNWYQNGQLEGEATYKNGKKDGLFRVWYQNGQLEGEGRFKNGEMDGLHRIWHRNGQLEGEGRFKNGEKDGLHRIWHQNGQLGGETTYKNGERDGLHRVRYQNGQLAHEVTYKNGLQDGLFRGWHGNGQLGSKDTYKNGRMDGLSRSWHGNGQLESEVTYKNGEKEGLSRKWHVNGQLGSKDTYKNGEMDGLSRIWYKNGQLEIKTTYKNGKIDGLSRNWYQNGQLEGEATFKNGEKEGLSRNWYQNGQLEREATFKNGEKEGLSRIWHQNGQLGIEVTFKNGKKEGREQEWYKNGQLRTETNFKNGKMDGLHRYWGGNGQLESEGRFKNGEKDGLYRMWHQNGQLMHEVTYKNGKTEGPRLNFAKEGEFDVDYGFQIRKGEIIGKSDIKAKEILINAAKQRQDTLPHEYAHHYISWFRDTAIVKEGIKRYGSEEKLVQLIGEQATHQKGEAFNWWKRFTKWVLDTLKDKEVLQILTDSFLNRVDISTQYRYLSATKGGPPNQPAGGPKKVTVGGLKTIRGAVARTPEAVSRTLEKIPGKTYTKEMVTSTVGKNLGKLPMYYKMPPEGVRADLRSSYPEGVTTAQLMKDGLRKATTRNKFGEIGDTFEVGGDKYIITEIRKVDLTTPEGKRAWANLEGWDADFAMKKYPNQVKTGATQTVFKKVEPPAEPAPVTSKNKFYAYVNPTEGKQGVIQGWDNIKSKIQGVSGARVQGFSTEKEAQTWLKKGGIYEPKGEGTKTKKEKFFAWKLPNGEEGVTSGWEETAKKVKGLSGAKFKGFETEGEASRWLRAGADYKVKHIAEKPGIYFDAGTGGTGEVRIGVSNERGDSFLTASAKMPEGATNNYGELLALKSALEHAKKTGGKEIFGDSKLVINFWSKGYVSNVIREKSPATYKLAQEVAKLRAEYEKTGGKIDYISGGSNPADLGYHKI